MWAFIWATPSARPRKPAAVASALWLTDATATAQVSSSRMSWISSAEVQMSAERRRSALRSCGFPHWRELDLGGATVSPTIWFSSCRTSAPTPFHPFLFWSMKSRHEGQAGPLYRPVWGWRSGTTIATATWPWSMEGSSWTTCQVEKWMRGWSRAPACTTGAKKMVRSFWVN